MSGHGSYCRDPRWEWGEPGDEQGAESFKLVTELYYLSDTKRDGIVSADEVVQIRRWLDEELELKKQRFHGEVERLNAQADKQAHIPLSLFSEYLYGAMEGVSNGDFKAGAAALIQRHFRKGPRIVVGPVIGKVTETTARILVEADADVSFDLVVTNVRTHEKYASRHSVGKNRPVALKVTGLIPNRRHFVQFKGLYSPVKSSFWTLPKHGYQIGGGVLPNFAVVSCNSVWTSWKLPTEGSVDLWADLVYRVREKQEGDTRGRNERIQYCVHIGDNVYNDFDWHLVEDKEKWKTQESDDSCKWANAQRIVVDKEVEELDDSHVQAVRATFREAYHHTWGYPPQRWVMANVANLMIQDDHDIRDGWGDKEEDKEETTIARWLGRHAQQLILEYQHQLFQDLVFDSPSRDYDSLRFFDYTHHHHALGEVGFLFLDVRGCKSFQYDENADKNLRMLGARQWRDIEAALNPGGTFDRCRALLVFTPIPVAFLTRSMTSAGSQFTMTADLLGMWSMPEHLPEAGRLLELMAAWRSRGKGRDTLLIGGDVHEGGWSDLQLDDAPEDSGRIRQLTTSAIANTINEHFQVAAISIAKNLLASIDGWELYGGWRYKHYDWTSWRNYALIQITGGAESPSSPSHNGSRGDVTIYGQLISADGTTLEEGKRRSSRDKPFTFVKKFVSAGMNMAGHITGAVGDLLGM